MTSLAIAKLACDALLFASLVLLSLKLIKKQPQAGANLLKLKELEASLKEVVREADDASQNFNNELLSRKRDLERVLADSQAIEGRISKASSLANDAVREAELIKGDLENVIQKSTTKLQQHETLIEKNITRSSRVSKSKEITATAPTPSFEYDKMFEPTSFSQISETKEKRVMKKAPRKPALSKLIEKRIGRSTPPTSKQSASSRPLQDSFVSVASAAERSIAATRLPDHLEEALASVEEQTQSLRKEDSRLGVLRATRRSSQVI